MSDFPVIENPTKLKVVELKEELDKRGLPTSGLKKDLVTRLEEAQGLVQPPDPTVDDGTPAYPPPALPSTKGEEQDHTTPAEALKDAALPPKDISDSNGPAVSEDVVSSEVAAAHHPEQAHATLPPPIKDDSTDNDKKEEKKNGVDTGVGHVMVEGATETTEEVREAEREIIKSPETKIQAEFQPAALDAEVSKVIAEEEMKDTIPPSPDRIRSASPVSVVDPANFKSESRVNTPPLGEEEGEGEVGKRDQEGKVVPLRQKGQGGNSNLYPNHFPTWSTRRRHASTFRT